MSSPADLSPPTAGALRRFGELSPAVRFDLALLAFAAAALTVLLWPHWRDNPDLSHGFFMPAAFLLLLHEARSGTARFLAPGPGLRLGFGLALVLGLGALCASGLYAAALDWTHALVAGTLTFSLVCLLVAGWCILASTTTRFLPWNWPAGVALGLWLLSTPIPPGTYTQLTLRLQLMVTESVLRALHLLGIAASRQGNVIELATTSVGVEEACSGVRSLISCLFAGLLFSGTLVQRPWARAVLIALAGPLALAMNFLRSLTLTLLANSGVDIGGRWHDLTGFAVLGVTAALLAALALFLSRASPSPTAAASLASSQPAASSTLPRILAAGLVVVAALAIFFVANTRPSVRLGQPAPSLAALLPTQADGWHVETSRELYQFGSALHTTHLVQRTYLRRIGDRLEQFTVYLAYWPAGQAPVSLVASHTPDACWPGNGWTIEPLPVTREALALPSRTLPDAEARFFRNGDFPQHVWFWHLYDGRPIQFRDPYSPKALLAIAWRYGFTHDGDQLFVRVSSNQPWSALAREPLVAEIFRRLQPLGL